MEKDLKEGRGGRRIGAGRPKGDAKLYTFRAGGDIARVLDVQKDRTAFIKDSIRRVISGQDADSVRIDSGFGDCRRSDAVCPNYASSDAAIPDSSCLDLSRFGEVLPASKARTLSLPSFDVRLVAGFPVPLDNDEKSQDIDMLRLLCPHPESSYLVRIQGDSMIDAGIESGDIVIVDKSRRNPTAKEIAVCELNGEYTVKHFVEEGGCAYLLPANPDYPRIPISEGDSFSVWGTVTYIIHKARD